MIMSLQHVNCDLFLVASLLIRREHVFLRATHLIEHPSIKDHDLVHSASSIQELAAFILSATLVLS